MNFSDQSVHECPMMDPMGLEEYLPDRNETGSNDSWFDNIPIAKYKQPMYIIIIFVVLYVIVFLLCIVGNLVVCCIIARTATLRDVTHSFILNLAVSDLLVGVFCIPFTLVGHIFTENYLGDVMCKVSPMLQGMSVATSVFTLTAIAFDRYCVIVHPTRDRLTVRQAVYLIIAIWVVAAIIMAPQAIVRRDESFQFGELNLSVCGEFWPSPLLRKAYSAFLFVICYAAPVLINTFLYGRTGYKLWMTKSAAAPKACSNQTEQRSRIIKMMVIIVAVFAITWMPLYSCWLLEDFGQLTHDQSAMLHSYIYPIAHVMAFANSAVDPFIYGLYSSNLRSRVAEICSRKKTKGNVLARDNNNDKKTPNIVCKPQSFTMNFQAVADNRIIPNESQE
ncbi:neuropeptide FF receptor 2-like [Branchiostoma floridae]|uniref:Neuropeptide FF receptor 2-like n=2 Tax=Branchiostoma floridae TaxID=7739 RepID=A0A9J7LDB1_BRAFL|nr:neuropeptide FF receptor 2-like [Branchiostoma floridae]